MTYEELCRSGGAVALVQAEDFLMQRGPIYETLRRITSTLNALHIPYAVAGGMAIVAYGYPGDGKPKPVAFPDPSQVAQEIDGISYVGLPTLIELKLASGLTGGVARLKDFVDVVEVIKSLRLTREFAEKLNPHVRPKFLELLEGIEASPRSDD